ncbi:MAG: hypothetical protein COB67_12675 [SAR324 cluster bacterium]|uniref:CHAT domain-containing protein n=1 Tax=SAR324 cluster bacterium TaxID=2024889 RepID=A0A2A4SQ54_9DELT|nr:MAG: hypothetical protein COB67_12675 [SAR324 cluster bacterium]
MKRLKAGLIHALFIILFFSSSLALAQEQQTVPSPMEEWTVLYEQSNSLLEQERFDEALMIAYQTVGYAEQYFGEEHPQMVASMYNLAIMLIDFGDVEQAEPLLNMTLELATRVLGAEHEDTVSVQSALGELYGEQGLYEKAQGTLEIVLRLRGKNLGEEHRDTLITMTTLAQIYEIQGSYDLAEVLLKDALKAYQQLESPDRMDISITQESLASLYATQGKFPLAEPLYLQVLTEKQNSLGEMDAGTLITSAGVAELYRKMGKYDASETLFLQTIDRMKEVLGNQSPDLYLATGNFAALLEERGNYIEAETLYLQVWNYDRQSLGEKHPNTIIDMNNLAGIYRKQGDYSQAEDYYVTSLEYIREALGDQHPETLSIMNNLALLYENQGLFEKAEPLFKEVTRTARNSLGTSHPKTLAFMNNLALLYESQGVFDKSEPLYRETIDLNAEVFGANHSNTIASVNNLGYLYLMQDKQDQAEPLFRRVLTQWEVQFGMKHQKTLKSLNNLARVLHKQGKLQEAERRFLQALSLRKEVLGEKHPDVIRSQIDLSALYLSQKEYDEAESLLEDTVSLAEEVLGKNHQYTFEALNVLAELYEQSGEIEDALKTRSLAFNRRSEFFDRVLWGTGENTRQAYIQLHQSEQDDYLTLIAAHNNSENARLALHVGLQRKGLLLKISSEIQKVLEMNNNADLADLAEKLTESRKALASMTLSGPKTESPEEFHRILLNLEDEVNDLQAELGRMSVPYRNTAQEITTDQIFDNIEDNAILVDYVAYKQKGQSKMMALVAQNKAEGCFILWNCKNARVDMIPLGDLEEIRKSISYFREAIQDEDAEEEDLLSTGQEIYQKIWAPLEKFFGNKNLIYIVPDSALHLLPFDAMIDEDDRYLIQTRDLRFLSSSRDLVITPLKRSQGEFVIFAGPDYDSDYLKERRKKIVTQSTRGGVAKGMRISSTGLRSLSFEPLDGAEIEGQTIKLVSDKGENPSVIFSKKIAEEQQLRNLKDPPQMLHIATHGFFLGAEESLVKRLLSVQRGGLQKIPPPGDNPLLRAGLAFAGINANAPFLGEIDTDNDGVLTAMEVLGLDLTGTKLVVLSACETGVGEIHDGEGVYGLRRAFQEAGVENVVNSLWPVSDEGTRRLMEEFYGRLFEKVPIQQALKGAQLNLINSEEWSHPYYWSAFVMVTRKDGFVQN